MDIDIYQIDENEKERLELYCHSVNSEVIEIVSFVKSRQGRLTGFKDNRQYEIPISDIFYIESVDNRVFIYCQKLVCETHFKLYELEEELKEKHFFRASKSVLLNLMKVDYIKPALNSRFIAVLFNGEQVMISRKYVSEFKKALKGGGVK